MVTDVLRLSSRTGDTLSEAGLTWSEASNLLWFYPGLLTGRRFHRSQRRTRCHSVTVSQWSDAALEVSLEVEWLLPKAAAREARQPEKPEKVTPFSWLPGSGCMAASDQCPRDFQRIVLYLHGGAYLLCTPKSLRGITFNVAAALQARRLCKNPSKVACLLVGAAAAHGKLIDPYQLHPAPLHRRRFVYPITDGRPSIPSQDPWRTPS